MLLQPGFVHEGSIIIVAHGRPDAPIRIAAAPGPGPSPVVHGSVLISNSSHIVLEDITVENARQVGIGIVQGSEHITVRHTTIRRNGLGVYVAMSAGGSNLIVDNDISDNVSYGIGVDRIINKVDDETTFADNRIFENGQFGIAIIGSRFIAERNTIYDNGRALPGTSGIHLYAGGFRNEPHIEGMGSHNIIRYNTIFRQHDDKSYDGNGIEADLWADDNEISYNICYDNDGAGIVLFGAARNRVFNNTLIGNYRDSGQSHLRPGGELVIATGEPAHGDAIAAGNIAKNNILVSTRSNSNPILIDPSATRSGTQLGGNLFFRTGPGNLYSWAWPGGVGDDVQRWNKLAKSVPADVDADPLFENIDDRPDGLRLRPESPAARLGTSVGLSRDHAGTKLTPGRAPSAGAFEVVTGR